MKKVLLLLAVSSSLVLAACSGSTPAAQEDSGESATIATTLGAEFTITLASNPSTGFKWTTSYDKERLTLVSDTYVPPATQMPGAGGKQQFLFRADRKGQTAPEFYYARSWEKDVRPAETKVFTVKVK